MYLNNVLWTEGACLLHGFAINDFDRERELTTTARVNEARAFSGELTVKAN